MLGGSIMAYVDGILGLLFQLGMVYEFPYGPSNKMLMPILAAYPDISKKFSASPAPRTSPAYRLVDLQQDASAGYRSLESKDHIEIAVTDRSRGAQPALAVGLDGR